MLETKPWIYTPVDIREGSVLIRARSPVTHGIGEPADLAIRHESQSIRLVPAKLCKLRPGTG